MTNPLPVLLLFQFLSLTHTISLQARRAQTTFSLLTNTTECVSTITHERISTFRNINPSSPGETLDGFLWDQLFLDSEQCQPVITNRKRQSTFLRPLQTSPPGVPPDEANPFFLEGRDNSPRLCANFSASFPATYLFTDDLPTFRERFVRDGFLDPGIAENSVRGFVYMFVIPANNEADIVGRACAYVEFEDVVLVTPQPDIPDMPACFPGQAGVTTPNGVRTVRELAIGDVVTVPNGYDYVISFTHSAEIESSFIQISTNNGSLTLSKDHLLLVNGVMKPADTVVQGDFLRRSTGDSRVEGVENVVNNGLYAPVTRSGIMIIDGFVVSCYTSLFGHHVSHALLSPVRGVSRIGSWDCAAFVDWFRQLWWGSQLLPKSL